MNSEKWLLVPFHSPREAAVQLSGDPRNKGVLPDDLSYDTIYLVFEKTWGADEVRFIVFQGKIWGSDVQLWELE